MMDLSDFGICEKKTEEKIEVIEEVKVIKEDDCDISCGTNEIKNIKRYK